MGHQFRPSRPSAASWQVVTDSLQQRDSPERLLIAMESLLSDGLDFAKNDEGFLSTFHVLAGVSHALEKEGSWGADLTQALGAAALTSPGGVGAALGTALGDRHYDLGARSDIAELSRNAAIRTIVGLLRSPGTDADPVGEVREALPDRVAGSSAFGRVAKAFIAGFVDSYVARLLSRELPDHLGAGLRFANLRERSEFVDGMRAHVESCCAGLETSAESWHASIAGGRPSTDESAQMAQALLSTASARLWGKAP